MAILGFVSATPSGVLPGVHTLLCEYGSNAFSVRLLNLILDVQCPSDAIPLYHKFVSNIYTKRGSCLM